MLGKILSANSVRYAEICTWNQRLMILVVWFVIAFGSCYEVAGLGSVIHCDIAS